MGARCCWLREAPWFAACACCIEHRKSLSLVCREIEQKNEEKKKRKKEREKAICIACLLALESFVLLKQCVNFLGWVHAPWSWRSWWRKVAQPPTLHANTSKKMRGRKKSCIVIGRIRRNICFKINQTEAAKNLSYIQEIWWRFISSNRAILGLLHGN